MQDDEYQHHFQTTSNRCETNTTIDFVASNDDKVTINNNNNNNINNSNQNMNQNKAIIQIDSSLLPTVEQIHNDNVLFSSNATVRVSNSGRRGARSSIENDDDDNDDERINSTFDDVYQFGDGIMKKKQDSIEDHDCNNITQTSKLRKSYNTLRSRKIVIYILVIITVLILSVVGFLWTKNRKNESRPLFDEHEYDDGNVNDVKKPNSTSTPPTTTTITLSQSDIGHIQQTSIDEKIAQIIYLLTIHTHSSTSHELATTDTYQYHAVQWLSQHDTYITTVPLNDIPYSASTSTNNTFSSWQYIQRYVIVALYYSLNGHNTWYNQYNFLSTNTSICDWNDGTTHGVFCNENKEVITLSLPSNNLHGSIPYEIGTVRSLQTIVLSNNTITGHIPEMIYELKKTLVRIDLSYNIISGEIPTSFVELYELEYINLCNNMLSGTIPFNLYLLRKLYELNLSNNLFTGNGLTSFESEQCPTNLTIIDLHNNTLSDTLSSKSFPNCNSLDEIDLSYNIIGGIIPVHFFNIRIVNLKNNIIIGSSSILYTIPPTNTLHIEYLNLANNRLTGPLLESITELSQLQYIDLSSNTISGSLYKTLDDFATFTKLEYLFLGNNTNLDIDPIPTMVKYDNLKEISLYDTNRIGTIPNTWGDLANLQYIDLHSNSISGTIPRILGNLQQLEYLYLNSNQLSGTVPPTINNDVLRIVAKKRIMYLDNNTMLYGDLEPFCIALVRNGENITQSSLTINYHRYTVDYCPPSNNSTTTTNNNNNDEAQNGIVCSCCDACCNGTCSGNVVSSYHKSKDVEKIKNYDTYEVTVQTNYSTRTTQQF